MGKRATVFICLVALVYTLLAVQWSLRAGRLAMDPVWDDVSYLVDGLERLNTFDQHGLGLLLNSLWANPPHSPWSTGLAFIGFALFGVNEWGPYVLNGCLVLILLFAGYYFFGQASSINQCLILSTILMMPLTLSAVHEFRPDFAVGLFTALFVLALVWLACDERTEVKEWRTYTLVGLLVGSAYLAKPSFFPHTTVMCAAAFCLAEICYRIFSSDKMQLSPTLRRLAGLLIGTVLVAGPYFLVGWRHVLNYFLINTGRGSDASVWKVPGGISSSFQTYLIGTNMVQMLGWFGPALLLWIVLGLTVSIAHRTPRSLAFIICGILLSALSASIIALGQMNMVFFGLTWQLTFLLTAIFAIGEACRSKRVSALAIGAAGLSLVLFCMRPPTTNLWSVSEDSRPKDSLAYLTLRKAADISSIDSQIKGKPSLFATFACDHLNTGSQRWLSLKYHMRIDVADRSLSGSLMEQMERAQISDFTEVADPKSKWLTQWVPSTALQESILRQLRAQPGAFEELSPIVGKEGTLYLFRRKLRLVNPIKGFSTIENGERVHVWAIDRTAELAIPEISDKSRSKILSFDLSTPNPRFVKITWLDSQEQTVSLIPSQLRHVEMCLLPSNAPILIKFDTDTDGVRSSDGGYRTLFFNVSNFSVRVADEVSTPAN